MWNSVPGRSVAESTVFLRNERYMKGREEKLQSHVRRDPTLNQVQPTPGPRGAYGPGPGPRAAVVAARAHTLVPSFGSVESAALRRIARSARSLARSSAFFPTCFASFAAGVFLECFLASPGPPVGEKERECVYVRPRDAAASSRDVTSNVDPQPAADFVAARPRGTPSSRHLALLLALKVAPRRRDRCARVKRIQRNVIVVVVIIVTVVVPSFVCPIAGSIRIRPSAPLSFPFAPFSSRFLRRLSRLPSVPRAAKVNRQEFEGGEGGVVLCEKEFPRMGNVATPGEGKGSRFSASPRDARERVTGVPSPPSLSVVVPVSRSPPPCSSRAFIRERVNYLCARCRFFHPLGRLV